MVKSTFSELSYRYNYEEFSKISTAVAILLLSEFFSPRFVRLFLRVDE